MQRHVCVQQRHGDGMQPHQTLVPCCLATGCAAVLLCCCCTPCPLATPDMLSHPGSTHLVITHKSLLRSMLCTALGLPPRQFRAIDLANGAVCMVR